METRNEHYLKDALSFLCNMGYNVSKNGIIENHLPSPLTHAQNQDEAVKSVQTTDIQNVRDEKYELWIEEENAILVVREHGYIVTLPQLVPLGYR